MYPGDDKWRKMSKKQQKAARKLGFDEDMWDDGDIPSDFEDCTWEDLNRKDRKWAEVLGYDEDLWDEMYLEPGSSSSSESSDAYERRHRNSGRKPPPRRGGGRRGGGGGGGLRNGAVVSLVQRDGNALHSNMHENSRISLGRPRSDKGWELQTEDGGPVRNGSRVHIMGVDSRTYMHDNAAENGSYSGGGRNGRVNWTIEGNPAYGQGVFLRGNSTGRYLHCNMQEGGGFSFGGRHPTWAVWTLRK